MRQVGSSGGFGHRRPRKDRQVSKLPNGHYRTAAGSEMWISGENGGRSAVAFDWLEEGACPECEVDPYDFDGMLLWHCEECNGGSAQLYPANPAACVWRRDEDGNWNTGCGGMFVIEEGTPADNDMRYCCYCGKTLVGPNGQNSPAAEGGPVE